MLRVGGPLMFDTLARNVRGSVRRTASVSPMPEREDSRERRLRRAAARQGLRLTKSRARDPRALLFGRYQLVNVWTNVVEVGERYGLDLDEVERALTSDDTADDEVDRRVYCYA